MQLCPDELERAVRRSTLFESEAEKQKLRRLHQGSDFDGDRDRDHGGKGNRNANEDTLLLSDISARLTQLKI